MFEIDIVKIGKKIIDNRRVVFKCLILSMIGCVAFLLVRPVSYLSMTTFTPQREKSSLSNLMSLSTFAGISLADIASLGDGINPMSFPRIVYSPAFLRDFMYKEIPLTDSNNTITILEYLTNPKYLTVKEKCYRYSFGYISYRNERKFDSNENISASVDYIHFSEQEQFCANRLKKLIRFEVYEKIPTIDFRVEMNDPYVAAYCASIGYDLLVDYLVQISQTKIDVRKAEVDSLFDIAQTYRDEKYLLMAESIDKNQSVSRSVDKRDLEKKRTDYSIASSFFNEVARERMMLYSKRSDNLLTLVSPAVVSNERYKPDYGRLLFLFVFFGTIAGLIIAYYK